MPKTTERRNAPEVRTSASEPLDEETIRARAYEISQRESAGSPEDNWQRAIAELHAERQNAGS